MAVHSQVKWLTDLSVNELAAEAQAASHPKWATLCLLRFVGFPTLHACYVPPAAKRQEIYNAATQFGARYGVKHLLLRSDGGTEVARYYRGGHSLPIQDAIIVANQLRTLGRAVLFMEPTNRFINRFSINLLAARSGSFVMEILGPGYDVSDLNRGGIRPQIVIEVSGVDWSNYRELWRSDLRVNFYLSPDTEVQRRQRRLEIIGREFLPALGIDVGGDPRAKAEQWLRGEGYMALWEEWIPSITLNDIKRWHQGAFLLTQYHQNRSWQALCCSGSDLGDGRFIFWDVVDGATKFSKGAKSF